MYTPGLIVATIACLLGSSLHRGFIETELNPLEFQIRNYLKVFSTTYNTQHSSNNTTVASVDIDENKVTTLWSVYSGIMFVGNMLGCVTVSTMADHLGRKTTLLSATGLCGILTLIQNVGIFKNIYPLLILGRIFNGYGAAVSSALTCMYLTEIAPGHIRWGLAAGDPLFMTAGSIVTAILALPPLLGTPSLWPFMFIVGAGLALPLSFLVCQPDGAKFLIQKNKSKEAVIASIHYYQGADVDANEIMSGYEQQVALSSESDKQVVQQFALVSQKKWRKHLALTLALGCGLAFGGIAVILAYLTSIIADAGISKANAQRCFLGVAIFRILVSVVVAFNIDKFRSRRKALLGLLWGCIALFVSMILVDLIDVYTLKLGPVGLHTFLVIVKVILIVTWSGLLCFINPMTVLTNLECYHQNQRAAAASVFLFVVYAGACFNTLAYPYLQSQIGYSSVVLLIPLLVLATSYLQLKLPETNQRDIDAISNVIASGRSRNSRMNEATPLL